MLTDSERKATLFGLLMLAVGIEIGWSLHGLLI